MNFPFLVSFWCAKHLAHMVIVQLLKHLAFWNCQGNYGDYQLTTTIITRQYSCGTAISYCVTSYRDEEAETSPKIVQAFTTKFSTLFLQHFINKLKTYYSKRRVLKVSTQWFLSIFPTKKHFFSEDILPKNHDDFDSPERGTAVSTESQERNQVGTLEINDIAMPQGFSQKG